MSDLLASESGVYCRSVTTPCSMPTVDTEEDESSAAASHSAGVRAGVDDDDAGLHHADAEQQVGEGGAAGAGGEGRAVGDPGSPGLELLAEGVEGGAAVVVVDVDGGDLAPREVGHHVGHGGHLGQVRVGGADEGYCDDVSVGSVAAKDSSGMRSSSTMCDTTCPIPDDCGPTTATTFFSISCSPAHSEGRKAQYVPREEMDSYSIGT
uniref:Uncharacterized protein n=1 Tax=Leersia perrieri TaxID=77586 RepID=A0A0D9WUK4_9ORYZ